MGAGQLPSCNPLYLGQIEVWGQGNCLAVTSYLGQIEVWGQGNCLAATSYLEQIEVWGQSK